MLLRDPTRQCSRLALHASPTVSRWNVPQRKSFNGNDIRSRWGVKRGMYWIATFVAEYRYGDDDAADLRTARRSIRKLAPRNSVISPSTFQSNAVGPSPTKRETRSRP